MGIVYPVPIKIIWKIIISGFGGQGVRSMGKILAY